MSVRGKRRIHCGGFSVVESMVAIGIAGVITVAVTKKISQSMKARTHVQAIDQYSLARSVIAKRISCTKSLDANLKSPSASFDPDTMCTDKMTTSSTAADQEKYANGNYFVLKDRDGLAIATPGVKPEYAVLGGLKMRTTCARSYSGQAYAATILVFAQLGNRAGEAKQNALKSGDYEWVNLFPEGLCSVVKEPPPPPPPPTPPPPPPAAPPSTGCPSGTFELFGHCLVCGGSGQSCNSVCSSKKLSYDNGASNDITKSGSKCHTALDRCGYPPGPWKGTKPVFAGLPSQLGCKYYVGSSFFTKKYTGRWKYNSSNGSDRFSGTRRVCGCKK